MRTPFYGPLLSNGDFLVHKCNRATETLDAVRAELFKVGNCPLGMYASMSLCHQEATMMLDEEVTEIASGFAGANDTRNGYIRFSFEFVEYQDLNFRMDMTGYWFADVGDT